MWYAMQTRPGREEAVKEKVQRLFAKEGCGSCKVLYYISKKRYLGQWHEEREKLLPGYVFLTAEDPPEPRAVPDRAAGAEEDLTAIREMSDGSGGDSPEPGMPPEGAEDPERVLGKMTRFTGLPQCGRLLSPIRKEEEELLKRLAGEKDEIGMSYGVIEDGVLKIKDGVLAGMESSVRKIDRHKRKGYIGLSLPEGGERLVGIGLEITEKT